MDKTLQYSNTLNQEFKLKLKHVIENIKKKMLLSNIIYYTNTYTMYYNKNLSQTFF